MTRCPLPAPFPRAAILAAALTAPAFAQLRVTPAALSAAAPRLAVPAAGALAAAAPAWSVPTAAPLALSLPAAAFAAPAPAAASAVSADAAADAAAAPAAAASAAASAATGADSALEEAVRLRAAVAEARALKELGSISAAMEKVAAAEDAYAAGPLHGSARRWEVLLPLTRLKIELAARGRFAYSRQTEAHALGVPLTVAGLRGWAEGLRARDPGAVVGELPDAPIAVQSWSDCAIHALWNLPALRALHGRMDYAGFLAEAEKFLGPQIRREGLNEYDSRILLSRLGWERGYDRAPSGADALARLVGASGGVVGGYAFPYPRWRERLGIGREKRTFDHAVAITAAVFDRGRWWFVVLDSRYAQPRVHDYGELLAMGLQVATVAPQP